MRSKLRIGIQSDSQAVCTSHEGKRTGKSALCLKCCEGRWTEGDSEPDTRACERCNDIMKRGNFYEIAECFTTTVVTTVATLAPSSTLRRTLVAWQRPLGWSHTRESLIAGNWITTPQNTLRQAESVTRTELSNAGLRIAATPSSVSSSTPIPRARPVQLLRTFGRRPSASNNKPLISHKRKHHETRNFIIHARRH